MTGKLPNLLATSFVACLLLACDNGDNSNDKVVTVGKSWASMHDDRLPHGDPEAGV